MHIPQFLAAMALGSAAAIGIGTSVSATPIIYTEKATGSGDGLEGNPSTSAGYGFRPALRYGRNFEVIGHFSASCLADCPAP